MIKIFQRYSGVLISIIVLLIDCLVPLGVAVGVLYIVPIFYFVKKSVIKRDNHYWFILHCSVFVFLGFIISPQKEMYWEVIANRILSLFIIGASYTFFIDFFSSKEELKKVNIILNRTNDELANITKNAPVLIVKIDLFGRLFYLNKTLNSNVDIESIIGKSLFDFVPEEQKILIKEKFKEVSEKKKIVYHSMEMTRIDKRRVFLRTSITPIIIDNKVKELLLITEDVTEEKEAKQQLELSLKEKDILLKEVHHRVKNNLQIIWGLLDLQQRRLKNKSTQLILDESKNRINSIALIHESLYLNGNFSMIRFNDYVSQLIKNAEQVNNNEKTIRISQKVEEINLSLDNSVPLGLIINEVLSNCYKHAFEGRNEGQINIVFKKEKNDIILMIEDDGVGFDAVKKVSNGIGLKLIENLCKQADGDYNMTSVLKKGTKYQITFNDW